jgi:hypothetical protein
MGMPIRIDAYTTTGMASGWLQGTATRVREPLERGESLRLASVAWMALDDLAQSTLAELSLEPDDIVALVADDETLVPVHATWHSVGLNAGPYRIEAELPTQPGFDPGRALTRPSGEFVLLRDVRLTLIARPEVGAAEADHALVNRYVVDRVEADLMLGFFFPGAEVDTSKLPAPSPAPG